MKLQGLKHLISNKWHICQSDMNIYDGNTELHQPSYNEVPTESGLYLVYMYDDEVHPIFHYEILEFDAAKFNICGNFFKRINSSTQQKNQGHVYFSSIIKWMKYNDFINILEENI